MSDVRSEARGPFRQLSGIGVKRSGLDICARTRRGRIDVNCFNVGDGFFLLICQLAGIVVASVTALTIPVLFN
jgi:hypothetical protein